MEKDERQIQLLLEQRNTLISEIKELNANMFKVVLAIVSSFVSVFLSYSFDFETINEPIIRFVLLDIIIILSMVISACLFAANINRDYISAIDKYLFNKHHISVLFFRGELSKKHTTGMPGIFPATTLLIGVSSAFVVGLLLVYAVRQDLDFYVSHYGLCVFLLIQIVAYLIIIGCNMIRKVTGKSSITKETLEYFERSENSSEISVRKRISKTQLNKLKQIRKSKQERE